LEIKSFHQGVFINLLKSRKLILSRNQSRKCAYSQAISTFTWF